MNEVSILYLLAFLTISGLIVVVLPAFILGLLYEFAGEMEASFHRRMDSIQQRIRHNSPAIQELLRGSQRFPKEPDEPFGAPLKQYYRSINVASARMRAVQAQYRALSHDAPASKTPGQSLGQKANLGIGWGRIWIQSQVLKYQTNLLGRETSRARRDFEQVLGVIKRVRQEVENTLDYQAQAEAMLSKLMQYNLRGALFEKAVTGIKYLQRVSRQVPASYRAGPAFEPARASDINAGEIKGVFQRAQTLNRGYASYIKQFADWQKQVDDLNIALADAQEALVQLYNTHSRVPKSLDIHELIVRIFEMNRLARHLAEFALQPDVAAVPQAKLDCLAIRQDAQALQRELERVVQSYTHWKNVFEQASQALNRLKDVMEEQESRQDLYPLWWVETREEYKLISEQLKAINDHAYKISAAQIQQDVSTCAQILRRAEQRRSYCVKKADTRRRLLGLWVQLGEITEASWVSEIRQLDAETHRFAAENWDQSIAVHSFLADGLQLVKELHQVIPADKASSILEGQLDALISRSHQIQNRSALFQNRIARIRKQLERVWDAERHAAQELSFMLDELQAVLTRLDNLGLYQARLDGMDQQVRQEIAQLKERGTTLGALLNRRENGSVFAKRSEIAAWVQAAVKKCQEVAQFAGEENTRQREEIRSRLAEIKKIALLNSDPMIQKAGLVLSLPARSYAQISVNSLVDLQKVRQTVQAAGRQIETGLMEHAALKHINDDLEGVLLPVRDQAQEVQEILAEIREATHRGQALDHGDRWPPTFIDMTRIKKRIYHLKLRHDEVFRGSTRANLKSNYASLKRECFTVLQDLWVEVRTAEAQDQAVRAAGEQVRALLRARRAMIDGYLAGAETAARAPELLRRWESLNRNWQRLAGGGFRGMTYQQIIKSLNELEFRLEELA